VNSSELLRHAVELARAGEKEEARDALLRLVEEDTQNELAWMWLAGLVDSLEDRIIACENVLTINPANDKARAYLEGLKRRKGTTSPSRDVKERRTVRQHGRDNPMEDAKYLEQDGKYDDALMLYKVEAAKASDTRTFNEIYKNIIRLENAQAEKIKYIAPSASILRLTFSWPLFYLSLLLIQLGMSPLKHLTSYLLFAFPWVVLGSYLVAVSAVRSRHLIWKRLFLDSGDGSMLARMVVGALGWIMILIPMLLIMIDSLNRLSVFQIPPRPF